MRTLANRPAELFTPEASVRARGSQSQADRGGLHCATTALRKLKMLGVAAAEACRMRARAPLRVPTNSLRSEPTDPIDASPSLSTLANRTAELVQREGAVRLPWRPKLSRPKCVALGVYGP